MASTLESVIIPTNSWFPWLVGPEAEYCEDSEWGRRRKGLGDLQGTCRNIETVTSVTSKEHWLLLAVFPLYHRQWSGSSLHLLLWLHWRVPCGFSRSPSGHTEGLIQIPVVQRATWVSHHYTLWQRIVWTESSLFRIFFFLFGFKFKQAK